MSCISGACVDVECLSTNDCPLEEICEDLSCVRGCYDDRDCLAGHQCLSGACIDYGCRETQLDCLVGEYCQEGTCVSVEPNPCAQCTYRDWAQGMDPLRECVIQSFDISFECDWGLDVGCPEGMSCYPADGVGDVAQGVCIRSYAFHVCVIDEDCPRGFYCAQDIYADGSDVHVCWGECPFFIMQGWL